MAAKNLESIEILRNVERDFVVYVWKRGDYHYEVEVLCSVTGHTLFKYEHSDISMSDARYIAHAVHKGLHNPHQ